jgi:hypothetical protein
MYIRRYSNFVKVKRINESIALFEAVLNIDKNIVDVLDQMVSDKNADEKYKIIAGTIKSGIGQDYKSNRYDQVSLSSDNKNFSVKSGKQTNTQSISKVIRTTLMAINPNFFKDNSQIKDDTIQKFADYIIGKMSISAPSGDTETKIVTGEEIKFWYDRKNMKNKTGSELSKSCMASNYKLNFMDFYVKNKNISLVVKLDADKKLIGRALLWKLESSSEGNEYFLDRRYCNENSDEEFLYNWVKSQPGYSKTGKRESKALSSNTSDEMVVKLDVAITKTYPYVDTMKYLYIKYENGNLINEGFLSNKKMGEGNKNEFVGIVEYPGHKIFVLQDTEGCRKSLDPEDRHLNSKGITKIITGLNKQIDVSEYDKPLGDAKSVINLLNFFKKSGDLASMFDIKITDDDVEDEGYEKFDNSTLVKPGLNVKMVNSYSGDRDSVKYMCLRAYDVSKLMDDREFAEIVEKISTMYMLEHKKLMTEIDLIILGRLDEVKSSEVYYVGADNLRYEKDSDSDDLDTDNLPKLTSEQKEERANELLVKLSKNDEALKLRQELIKLAPMLRG